MKKKLSVYFLKCNFKLRPLDKLNTHIMDELPKNLIKIETACVGVGVCLDSELGKRWT